MTLALGVNLPPSWRDGHSSRDGEGKEKKERNKKWDRAHGGSVSGARSYTRRRTNERTRWATKREKLLRLKASCAFQYRRSQIFPPRRGKKPPGPTEWNGIWGKVRAERAGERRRYYASFPSGSYMQVIEIPGGNSSDTRKMRASVNFARRISQQPITKKKPTLNIFDLEIYTRDKNDKKKWICYWESNFTLRDNRMWFSHISRRYQFGRNKASDDNVRNQSF